MPHTKLRAAGGESGAASAEGWKDLSELSLLASALTASETPAESRGQCRH